LDFLSHSWNARRDGGAARGAEARAGRGQVARAAAGKAVRRGVESITGRDMEQYRFGDVSRHVLQSVVARERAMVANARTALMRRSRGLTDALRRRRRRRPSDGGADAEEAEDEARGDARVRGAEGPQKLSKAVAVRGRLSHFWTS